MKSVPTTLAIVFVCLFSVQAQAAIKFVPLPDSVQVEVNDDGIVVTTTYLNNADPEQHEQFLHTVIQPAVGHLAAYSTSLAEPAKNIKQKVAPGKFVDGDGYIHACGNLKPTSLQSAKRLTEGKGFEVVFTGNPEARDLEHALKVVGAMAAYKDQKFDVVGEGLRREYHFAK